MIPVHSQKQIQKDMRSSLLLGVALKVIFRLPSAIEAHSDLGGKVASWSSECPFNYMQQAALYLLSVAELPNIMSPPEFYAHGTGNEEMTYK